MGVPDSGLWTAQEEFWISTLLQMLLLGMGQGDVWVLFDTFLLEKESGPDPLCVCSVVNVPASSLMVGPEPQKDVNVVWGHEPGLAKGEPQTHAKFHKSCLRHDPGS